jgi:hypothetical protein
MRWASVAIALAGAKSFVVALDPVSVVGNKFFNKDGSQFFIKGMDEWIIDTQYMF